MALRPQTIRPLRLASIESWRGQWPMLVFAIALPVGIYGRIVAGWRMPLWFDETFTGTIASQRTVGDLITWCRHELTGPAFYMPMWGWAQIAGTSDAALRLPSLLLSLATPLLLARYGHPDRRLRLVWATFVLLWAPSLTTATEARPYALLFLMGSLQAIAFLRLIRAPDIGAATVWSAVTAFMGLTHYHSLTIGAFEGLAFLAWHRRRAFVCWPAVAAFFPLAGWMSLHLPFVLAFSQQYGAVYTTLGASSLPFIRPTFVTWSLGATIALAAIAAWHGWQRGIPIARFYPTPEMLLALCGVGAVLLELLLGFVHAGFMPRYLTPSMPAVLFLFALCVRRLEHRDPMLVVGLHAAIAIPFAAALHAAWASPTMDARHLYNFERASAWLAQRRPDHLAFLWSDGISTISSDRQIGEVAGFFLHRRGIGTVVTVVHPRGDPSTALRVIAGADPDAAILWIANDENARQRIRPAITEQDQAWECRDFGGRWTILTACRRRREATVHA